MSIIRGAVIEIVEKRRRPESDSLGASVVVPNDVRINGQSLATAADHPVIVHEMSTSANDVVRVTLTLMARRVYIGHEDTPEPSRDDLTEIEQAQAALLQAQREAHDVAYHATDRVVAAQQALVAAHRRVAEASRD